MRRSEHFLPTIIGLALVALLSLLIYFTPGPLKQLINFIERGSYDWQVFHYHKPLPPKTPLLIIDIDDESLAQVGRWPWKRDIMGDLTSRLFDAGAKVVVFDVMFPESEDAQDDTQFAEGLKKGTSILGYAFKDSNEMIGQLPKPLFTFDSGPVLQVPEKKGFLSSIPILNAAAASQGFLNSSPDSDGVIRSSPLLLRRDQNVYGALGLMGAYFYMGMPPISLASGMYHKEEVLEGIVIGDRFVSVDSQGKILIPFRGPPYSFPTISAGSILKGAVPANQLKDRLVLIGSSATALGDLNPTAIYPIFAGVEIHATIAQGILDGYLPYRPAWALGAESLLLFLSGTLSAILLPRARLAIQVVWAFGVPSLLLLSNEMVWSNLGIVLSMIFPISAVEVLFLMNLIWGYLYESKRRRQIRALFSEYISSDRIDQILSAEKNIEMEGESKELTVLFADIRDFTAIAEKMDAAELKQFLTDFFTPMTEVIFKNRGTIDKYVGDLVMAFWGAPLDDSNHALHAVETALEMQKRLSELNVEWKAQSKPEVKIGIGINTGIMSVGDMGSRFRKAYTVLGDSVNLGSRLESLSKYYRVSVIVGQTTADKTKSVIAYRKLDRVRVLGKKVTVEIFEPLSFWNEISGADKERIEQSEKALNAYFAKDWAVAKEQFTALLASDSVWARHFLERIDGFMKSPPPQDWDGAFILETK